MPGRAIVEHCGARLFSRIRRHCHFQSSIDTTLCEWIGALHIGKRPAHPPVQRASTEVKVRKKRSKSVYRLTRCRMSYVGADEILSKRRDLEVLLRKLGLLLREQRLHLRQQGWIDVGAGKVVERIHAAQS